MDWECIKSVLTEAAQPVGAIATVAAAIATWLVYYLAKRALPDHQKQVKDLRDADLQVVLSDSCVDVRAAHDQFLNFPDVENCPKERQSSHFYVKSNDVLMGKKFSKTEGATSQEDWCYLGVFLKNEKKIDAYSDIILRFVSNQDEKRWVFYGHKDQLKFERRTEAIYSSPPYSQEYRIPVIRPQRGDKSRFLGVVKVWKRAELTDHWDKVFTYALYYRIRGAEIRIAEGEIPIDEKLRACESSSKA